MRIGEVRAVLELRRCSGHRMTAEQIHTLILLSARVKRLVAYGLKDLSDRQKRAYQRALDEAWKIASEYGASVRTNSGIVVVWRHCDPTEL